MVDAVLRKVMVVIGTRPEAVKMAPVISELKSRPQNFLCQVVSTGQHREMLRQTLSSFGLKVDIDLDLMQPDQTLASLTGTVVTACEKLFLAEKPDIILVQGDTTTVLAAALAAHYCRIPIGHVEAGLRTHERYNPFPEEMNRRLVASLASLHFAPTTLAEQSLLREGVEASKIFVTGNTVVDAIHSLRDRADGPAASPTIRAMVAAAQGRLVLITCHRRESFEHDLGIIVSALATLAANFPERTFFFPLHLNPNVRALVLPRLTGIANIVLADPIPYEDLQYCLAAAELVMTDSGGLQEEAPSFGVPVIVLRRTTERPEGVAAGFAQLVPIEHDGIVALAADWITSRRKSELVGKPSPFGDGQAAKRIADLVSEARFP